MGQTCGQVPGNVDPRGRYGLRERQLALKYNTAAKVLR